MVKNLKTSLIGLGLAAVTLFGLLSTRTKDLSPNLLADSPNSLYQSFDFINGGSSSNSAYASVNIATDVSYAADNPGGAGLTAWEADYANLSMTTQTRLGGKLVSTVQTDDTTAWCNIKTTFSNDRAIHTVKIYNAGTFGTAGNVGSVYLQYSATGTSWTTIKTLTPSYPAFPTSAPYETALTIVFDGFTIPADSYVRFGVALTASGTSSGLAFTKISFHSYELCV